MQPFQLWRTSGPSVLGPVQLLWMSFLSSSMLSNGQKWPMHHGFNWEGMNTEMSGCNRAQDGAIMRGKGSESVSTLLGPLTLVSHGSANVCNTCFSGAACVLIFRWQRAVLRHVKTSQEVEVVGRLDVMRNLTAVMIMMMKLHINIHQVSLVASLMLPLSKHVGWAK